MLRFTLVFLSVLLLMGGAAAQRHSGIPGASGTDVTIRVTYPDGRRPDANQIRVQLLNAGGVPLADGYVTSMGEVMFHNLGPAVYTVHVTGPGIDDVQSSFQIEGGELVHSESVVVRASKMGTAEAPAPGHATVSAVEMNAPDRAKDELKKGDEAFQKQNYDKAIDHFNKAIHDYPKFGIAYHDRGLACIAKKDLTCARESFEKAAEVDPGFAPGLVRLALTRMMDHNYPGAQDALNRALRIEPQNPEALTMLADVDLQLGQYNDAIAIADKVHNGPHAGFAVVHIIAGRALEADHQPQRAAAEYHMCEQESPSASPSAVSARQALERLGGQAAAQEPATSK
jgi:Tfp pilus assembly protein PilF